MMGVYINYYVYPFDFSTQQVDTKTPGCVQPKTPLQLTSFEKRTGGSFSLMLDQLNAFEGDTVAANSIVHITYMYT